MAKYTKEFTLAKPQALVSKAARRFFKQPGWRLMDDSGWAFYATERLDLAGRLMSYPTKIALFIRSDQADDDSDDSLAPTLAETGESAVALHMATFGFGPLPRRRMLKVSAHFQARLGALIDQLEAETPAE